MRISDWSSDVCSSDLRCWYLRTSRSNAVLSPCWTRCTSAWSARWEDSSSAMPAGTPACRPWHSSRAVGQRFARKVPPAHLHGGGIDGNQMHPGSYFAPIPQRMDAMNEGKLAGLRSEEHTSELQSLMRSSYDVFCWK